METFEEVTLICEGCGKKVKVVRREGEKTDKFLCQACGQGETWTDD